MQHGCGKHHEMPVHHTLEEYLDSYIQAAGIEGDKKGLLFRSAVTKNGQLSDRPLDRVNAFLRAGLQNSRARRPATRNMQALCSSDWTTKPSRS